MRWSLAWARLLVVLLWQLLRAGLGTGDTGRSDYREGTQIPLFELPGRVGPIKEVDGVPESEDFIREYTQGWGQPVLFRGIGREQAVFQKWALDATLNNTYGDELLDNIENGKKENRGATEAGMSMRDFLSMYNESEVYCVSELPQAMARDVILPRFLQCGYPSSYLSSKLLWFSSGGTKSVIHSDDQDNINCVLSGTKRLAMWHPLRKPWMEDLMLTGWVNTDKLRQDPEYANKYGDFAGPPLVDVDGIRVDIFPTWTRMEWWDVQMKAGDCLFIPTNWYHHVLSPPGRNIAVNVWWRRHDETGQQPSPRCSADSPRVTFADCSWGYLDTGPGNTRCKGQATDSEEVPAQSVIQTYAALAPRQIRAGVRSGPIPPLQQLLEAHPSVASLVADITGGRSGVTEAQEHVQRSAASITRDEL